METALQHYLKVSKKLLNSNDATGGVLMKIHLKTIITQVTIILSLSTILMAL